MIITGASFAGLEGAMGEQAVEADRDPDRGQQVHHRCDRQVGWRYQAVPEQDDRGHGRGEGNHDGAEVGGLLNSSHLTHAERR